MFLLILAGRLSSVPSRCVRHILRSLDSLPPTDLRLFQQRILVLKIPFRGIWLASSKSFIQRALDMILSHEEARRAFLLYRSTSVTKADRIPFTIAAKAKSNDTRTSKQGRQVLCLQTTGLGRVPAVIYQLTLHALQRHTSSPALSVSPHHCILRHQRWLPLMRRRSLTRTKSLRYRTLRPTSHHHRRPMHR
jgi:hypothetical protein